MHFEIKNINNVDKLNIFENRWAEIHIINVKGKIKSISNCNASSEQKKRWPNQNFSKQYEN